MSNVTINFLALTLFNKDIPADKRRPCTNCGNPECNSIEFWTSARLFDEAERDLALALLDGDEPLDTPVPPLDAFGSAIGRHFRGGKTVVFEIHHTDAPHEALQSFALEQSFSMQRRLLWQGPRVAGDLDPAVHGLEGVLAYEPDAPAIVPPSSGAGGSDYASA